MKVDLDIQPKDYLKGALLLAALAASLIKPDTSGERMAVLETEVRNIRTDVSEIKHILTRRNR